ncbi:MAG: hypothetical protein UY21_C0010G0011 [Microgenomates group bacterium GW2011_GWA1_48_10]|nr:MAG: hypothetical protein UY21_C0010G0011 [Microgenomates group bacterium GW2011_GWA1_48_10]
MPKLTTNSRILIYGFAREGASTLKFLRHQGLKQKIFVTDDREIEIWDEQFKRVYATDQNLEFIQNPDVQNKDSASFDAIILTPGKSKWRLPAELWPILTNQTAIFLDKFPHQTIGVTGTKGKSTTSTLIFEMLRAAGKNALLIGNIGKPPLDYYQDVKPNTIIVFELSSHQLSLVSTSPHVAVLLNVFPEHLDYYPSLKDYVSAKANITKFQTQSDNLIYNSNDQNISAIARQSPAKQYPITSSRIRQVTDWETSLPGNFNKLNIAAAFEAVKIFGVTPEIARDVVKNFKPLEHRLELVGTFQGITFYNDSISTIPEATIAALDTLSDRVQTLFVGGFDRGVGFGKLAKRIVQSPVENLILFPTTGPKIWREIQKLNWQAKETYLTYETSEMKSAVNFAFEVTAPGKIALLSPASPSFNLFKDYADRGKQFKGWVVKLGKKPNK